MFAERLLWPPTLATSNWNLSAEPLRNVYFAPQLSQPPIFEDMLKLVGWWIDCCCQLSCTAFARSCEERFTWGLTKPLIIDLLQNSWCCSNTNQDFPSIVGHIYSTSPNNPPKLQMFSKWMMILARTTNTDTSDTICWLTNEHADWQNKSCSKTLNMSWWRL